MVKFNKELLLSDGILSSLDEEASYQWLDCEKGGIAIPGEIGRGLTSDATGQFSVQLTKNECKTTTDCIGVTNYACNCQKFF